MSCIGKTSDSKNFPIGVLGSVYPSRTQFDIDIIKKTDTSKIPDCVGPSFPSVFNGIKEGFCPCSKVQQRAGRTLAFDDPSQQNSYTIRY